MLLNWVSYPLSQVKEKSDTPDNLKLPHEQSTALCVPTMSIQHVTKHKYPISNVYLKAGKLQDFPNVSPCPLLQGEVEFIVQKTQTEFNVCMKK